ncbi:MAG TPA: hypothetical protein DCF70_04215 [Treponema sp.]|nr:hypothetical protein [Treponema sp.]
MQAFPRSEERGQSEYSRAASIIRVEFNSLTGVKDRLIEGSREGSAQTVENAKTKANKRQYFFKG